MPGIVGGFGTPGRSTFVPAGGGKPVTPGPSTVKLPGAARPATPGPSTMPAPPGGHPATPGPSHVTPIGGGKPATPGPSTMPAPSGGAPISPAQFGGGSGAPANAGHIGGTIGGGGGSMPMRKPVAPPKAPAAPPPPPALNPSQFPNTPGTLSSQQIQQQWMQNAPNNLKDPAVASNMANIAQAESSDTPSTIQQGQPPGTTGYGTWQITPTSGSAGGWSPKAPTNPGANNFGNLLNIGNNVRAAANVLQQQGYHAFTDPVGLNLPSGPVTK